MLWRQEEPTILISRLLLRIRRMNVASIHLDFTKKEWNAQNTISSGTLILDHLSLVIWSRVSTICHVKVTQSTAMEQKCFDLRSMPLAHRNLWLLLVIITRLHFKHSTNLNFITGFLYFFLKQASFICFLLSRIFQLKQR